jgi:Holliday junction resolvase RusA-like endonuclease
METITLDLPFPTSTNRLWRVGVRRLYNSPEYEAWKREATGMFWQQYARKKRPQRLANFKALIVLDERRRSRCDNDNRIKATLDFCQAVGLIGNDRNCDEVTARWGEAPTGARVILTGEPAAATLGLAG